MSTAFIADQRLTARLNNELARYDHIAQQMWAEHGYKRDSKRRTWLKLDSGARNTLIQSVSIAHALAHSPRGSGPVHEAAHAVRDMRDSGDWFANFVLPVHTFRKERAQAVKRGDSLTFEAWTTARTDSFSPTSGGASEWWSAQRIAENLEIPREPIERMSIGIRSDFNAGARSTEQALIAKVGRAEKMDPSIARGGNLTRRITPQINNLHWFAAQAVTNDFLDLEYGFMGVERDPLAEVQEALELRCDEVFYRGMSGGVSPFGVYNHPGMRRHAGDNITSGTSVTEAVNVVAAAVERLADGSSGAAQTTLCQIGGTVWNRLHRATTETSKTGISILREMYPQVTFERSYRLKDIASGKDGILCVDQRAGNQGLKAQESALVLVTYNDGPDTVVMGARKTGGAYPATGIYAQLNLVNT